MEYKISQETIFKLGETSPSAQDILRHEFPLLFIEQGYYYINDTLKVLHWDGEKWQQAVKDRQNMYTFVRDLEKQPKNIKSVERYRSMYDIL